MLVVSTLIAKWLCQISTTLSLFGCAYALAATALTRRFVRRVDAARSDGSSVTILKPLCGLEIDLAENLASFCRQDYRAPMQIIFGVQSGSDPAVSVFHELSSSFPDLNMRLVINECQHGANRKVSNLINMSRFIEHDIIVLADSDVRVEPDYLKRLCGALEQPNVGLVTCLYRGGYTGTLWSSLACMSMQFHFLPSVVVGLALGLASPCLGPTIALRRETLSSIGGFEAVADQLADDYVIGAAVTKLGRRIEIPSFLITQNCPERSLSALFQHELRWARTIFRVDPIGFVGAGVTHAFPLAILAGLFGGFDFWGWALIAFALGCRLWLQAGVARAFDLQTASLLLAPLSDMFSFLVYVACFFGSRVDWRGHRYSVDGKGNLTPYAASGKGKSAL